MWILDFANISVVECRLEGLKNCSSGLVLVGNPTTEKVVLTAQSVV